MVESILQTKIARAAAAILLLVFIALIVALYVPEPPSGVSAYRTNPQVVTNPPQSVYDAQAFTAEDRVWGSRTAPVKLLLYEDVGCPTCSDNYQTAKQLVHNYGGDVAFAYRHYNYASRSSQMPLAAECAAYVGKDGAFWLFLEKLHGMDESESRVVPVHSVINSFGVNNGERFDQCISEKRYQARIQATNSEAALFSKEQGPRIVVVGPAENQRSLIIGVPSRDMLTSLIDAFLSAEDAIVREAE